LGAPDEKTAGGAAGAAAVLEVMDRGVRALRVGDGCNFGNRRGDRTVVVGNTLAFSPGRAASGSVAAGPALAGV
jgi:hypothetical protein